MQGLNPRACSAPNDDLTVAGAQPAYLAAQRSSPFSTTRWHAATDCKSRPPGFRRNNWPHSVTARKQGGAAIVCVAGGRPADETPRLLRPST